MVNFGYPLLIIKREVSQSLVLEILLLDMSVSIFHIFIDARGNLYLVQIIHIVEIFLRINRLKGNGWELYPISEGDYFVLPIDYPQYNPVEICAFSSNPEVVSKKIKKIADTMFRFECNVVVFYHYGNPIEYIPSCKVAWTNGAIFGYNNSDFFDENDKNNEWDIRYEDALRG